MQQYEAEQQYLLAMVEAAQQRGRSEREIVAIVERYFGDGSASRLGLPEAGVVRRLLARRRAA
jgi:hypothetical protein